MKNKRNLGQYWLRNREILEEIAEAAKMTEITEAVGDEDGVSFSGQTSGGDARYSGSARAKTVLDARYSVPVCVEIGPGLGTLTASLLRRFEKVIAVEVDRELAEKLPKSFPGKNLEVVNEDILRFDFARAGEKFVVAGNIPYYITSPIITRLLELEVPPRRIVLLVQEEVAQRIVSERESVLSLMVKNRAEVRLGAFVPRAEFMPAPKVDSRVIILQPHAARVSEGAMRLVRQGFAAPRKKLVNNLAGRLTAGSGGSVGKLAVGSGGSVEKLTAGSGSLAGKLSAGDLAEVLKAVGIDENARAEEVHLEGWQRLAEELEQRLRKRAIRAEGQR